MILHNAHIHIPSSSPASALLIRGGRIGAVGSSPEILALRSSEDDLLDLDGAFIYPGFTDAHCHLHGIGERELTLSLEGCTGLDELLSRLQARAAADPVGEWIVGRGWIEAQWSPPRFPTRQDLDAVAPNHAVILTRADGHASVVNSAALQIAGISATTVESDGGQILRDAEGQPNGLLIDRAQSLVRSHLPDPTEQDIAEAFRIGAAAMARYGWTAIHDVSGEYADIARLRGLQEQDELGLRVYKSITGPGHDADRFIDEGPIIGACDGLFTCRSIKLFFDGALGSRGAALLAPYSDDLGNTGLLLHTADDVQDLLRAALRAGIQVMSHAIGDAANRVALDAYERAFHAVASGERAVDPPRWRIEHAQILDPADFSRFGQLGILPSMQPSHAITDLHFAEDRLGSDRLKLAYAWQSFREAGCILPGGSDAPVERGDPRIEYYAAFTRQDLRECPDGGWHPEQRLSRVDALRTLTEWPAYAAFEEQDRGTIEPGKRADLTIFSDDLLAVSPADVLTAECLYTIVGGRIIHRSN